MIQFEGEFKSFDEESLFYQIWKHTEEAKNGWIIITHGQGEHSECYQRVVQAIAPHGFHILAWDLRGHGRSGGKRGYARSFTDYVEDFAVFHKKIVSDIVGSQKRVWLAHSMGGLIQLGGLLKIVNGTTEKQVLSNPYLGLALEIPLYKSLGAILLKNYLPKITLGNEIDDNQLTRDTSVLKEFKKDALRHHKISSGVHVGAGELQKDLLNKASLFTGPILMQVAESDPVCSTARNLSYFELLGSQDKTLKVYPNRKHEIYNDLERDEVFADLNTWLSAHS